MNAKRLVLIALMIPSFYFVPTQEKISIKQFDQYYTLYTTGNLKAVWDITIVPGEGTESMFLHVFFSKKAYVKDAVVTDSEGSLNSKMVSREGVPVLEITFRKRLSAGVEYHFKCTLDVWKAVEVGETEGSFTLLTGYNFPVETLNITAVIPEGTKLRSFFPADGKVSAEKSVSWSMESLPAGYTIQVSLSFDVLSEKYADTLFNDAVNLYHLQDFEGASQKFEQARLIYEALHLQEKVDQCDTYFARIEGLKKGLPLFKEAVQLYTDGNYSEAAAKFREVKSIYEEHQLPTDEVESYLVKCDTYVSAFSELQTAETLLGENKGTEAREHLVKARELFLAVNDTTMVEQVDARIAQISSRTEAPQTKTGRKLFLFIAVVAIVAVVAAVFVVSRRPKPSPVQSQEEIQEEMRKVKARFVYGEINKKEYDEKLAELEKQLRERKS